MKTSRSPRTFRIVIILAVVLAVVAFAVWQISSRTTNAASNVLTASGTIEARVVHIASELSGRVTQVSIDEGQPVQAGQVLVKLDDAILQDQYAQAKAAVQVAQANYDLLKAGPTDEQLRQAQAALDAAKANYALLAAGPTSDQVRQAQAAVMVATANYSRTVEGSRQSNVAAAQSALNAATDAYNKIKAGPQKEDIATADANVKTAAAALQQAQFAYDAANRRDPASVGASPAALALQQATNSYNAAKSQYDKVAKAPDNAQLSAAYQQVQNARAALDVAQNPARDFDVAQAQGQVDQAQAALDNIKAGARAEQLAAAQAQVDAAQAQLDALKAGARTQQLTAAQGQVDQAQAQVRSIEEQLKKTVITSPVNAIVLNRNIEQGEIASPGAVLYTIGQLTTLEVSVYLPEAQFALVTPGDHAILHVDAYPGRDFSATVLNISDQAEFTPRNVQTVEGRKDTVYAVRLSIDNPDLALKAGMPADVTFGQK